MSAGLALAGKTVLLTRARAQSEESVALLSAHGAKCLVFPVISIHTPSEPKPFQHAVASLSAYEWIVFTSVNGVRATLDEVARQKIANAFSNSKIAVVGSSTAHALEDAGVHPTLVAKEFRGDALANDLLATLGEKSRVAILRAKVAREILPDTLRAAGHAVDVIVAYETKPAAPEDAKAIADALGRGEIDFVTFTSASTVEQFCALFGSHALRLLEKTRVISIGPVTTQAAEKLGVAVAKTASPHTVAGLVDALIEVNTSP
ncbi:MAG: uroporphyrinogen-III synthase [Polyangiaceae bacterium]